MEMMEMMGGYPERPSLWIITIMGIMSIMCIIMSSTDEGVLQDML